MNHVRSKPNIPITFGISAFSGFLSVEPMLAVNQLIFATSILIGAGPRVKQECTTVQEKYRNL